MFIRPTSVKSVDWLFLKITTNEITAVSELVVWTKTSYEVCKAEGSGNCRGIGLACTNAPRQVVMMSL